MSDICIFSGFENIVSTIKLNQSLLACTDTKHQNQNSKRFHSTNDSRSIYIVQNSSPLMHGRPKREHPQNQAEDGP